MHTAAARCCVAIECALGRRARCVSPLPIWQAADDAAGPPPAYTCGGGHLRSDRVETGAERGTQRRADAELSGREVLFIRSAWNPQKRRTGCLFLRTIVTPADRNVTGTDGRGGMAVFVEWLRLRLLLCFSQKQSQKRRNAAGTGTYASCGLNIQRA